MGGQCFISCNWGDESGFLQTRTRKCKDCGTVQERECLHWKTLPDGSPPSECLRWSSWKDIRVPRGGCFITTSICQTLNKPDDCIELNILRKFRDKYLLTNTNYRNMVHHYYDIAPDMVTKLEAHKNKDKISQKLYDKFLKEIIIYINDSQHIKAINKYKEMLDYLSKEIK